MVRRKSRKKRKTKKREKTRKIYGPKYNQKKWLSKYVKKSHNCYSYFMNNINKSIVRACKNKKRLKKATKKVKKTIDRCYLPQPGNVKGYPPLGPRYKRKRKDICRKVNERVLADNKEIYNTTMKKGCKKKEYMGAMVVSGRGYHFYRRDKDGYWSHKFGRLKPVKVDTAGNKIKDPKTAKRNWKRTPGYSTKKAFCKYYCLPMDKRKRKISLRKEKKRKRRKSRKKKN